MKIVKLTGTDGVQVSVNLARANYWCESQDAEEIALHGIHSMVSFGSEDVVYCKETVFEIDALLLRED